MEAMEARKGAADPQRLVVEVSYQEDAQGAFLVVDPPFFELHDGEWVVWKFRGVPAGLGAVPALRFDRRLGPFHTLRTAPDSQSVVGKGNVGGSGGDGGGGEEAAGRYAYHAALVSAGGAVSTRTPAELENRATRLDTTPEVRVRYLPGREGKLGEFVVEPFVLRLNDGDSPFWTFYDLPEDGSIYLYATASQEGAPHPLLGPFQSLTSLRSGDGGASSGGGVSQFVVGTGQGQSPPGRYHYHIALVGADGETLASGDPVIDNGGPPG